MAVLHSLHKFAGKIDPVVKWTDKKGLTPLMLREGPMRPESVAAPRATASGADAITPREKRRASAYLGTRGG